MSASELAARVAQQLAQIPHDDDCGDLRCDCGEEERHAKFKASIQDLPSAEWVERLSDWFKTDPGHTEECRTLRYRGTCCSRDQRVAAGVVRFGEEIAFEVAKEMQANWWPKEGPSVAQEAAIKAEALELGLQALGASPQPETR